MVQFWNPSEFRLSFFLSLCNIVIIMVVFIIFYLLLKAGDGEDDLANESLDNNRVCKAAIAKTSGSANNFKGDWKGRCSAVVPKKFEE